MLRRLREFATALLGLLVFQLSPLGATAACLAPVGGGIVAEATPGVADTGAVHGQGAAHGLHARGPDDTPQPRPADDGAAPPHHEGQKHCPASMACAVVAVAAVSSGLPGSGLRAAARIAAPDSAAPASVVGAPEPPPPRA